MSEEKDGVVKLMKVLGQSGIYVSITLGGILALNMQVAWHHVVAAAALETLFTAIEVVIDSNRKGDAE